MKNQIHKYGNTVPFTATEDVLSGALVKIGDMVGIATNDIKTGETETVVLQGVFECPKAAGFTAAKGSKLYYDAAAKNLTGTASGNTLAGYAFDAAASADTLVNLKLVF